MKIKAYTVTALSEKAAKVVERMYNNKDNYTRKQIVPVADHFAFRAVVTDRNVLRKPHNEEVFKQAMHVVFKASGINESEYKIEVEEV